MAHQKKETASILNPTQKPPNDQKDNKSNYGSCSDHQSNSAFFKSKEGFRSRLTESVKSTVSAIFSSSYEKK